MDRVGTRPENAHQARLLRLLRDRGQASRAELGEAVGLSKSKVAVELDRLTELGLIEPQGLAESRGGRRSHLVGLAGSLRFVGIDIGATSIDVAITDGELRLLAHAGIPSDVRRGPKVVLQEALDLVAKLRADVAAGELHAGTARSVDDFLFVKLGTGIGCGIILGGQVYRGADGAAGDIGHIRIDDAGPTCTCGNQGCLEAYFGGGGLPP